MKRYIYWITVVSCALVAGLMTMHRPASANDDDIVAEINGSPITRIEFLDFARQVAERHRQSLANNPDLLKQILETYIERKLILEYAEKNNIEEAEGFEEALQSLKEGLIVETFITSLEKEMVTEDLIRARYNEQKAAHKPKVNYHAKHILVASEEEARELLDLLKNPEADFGTLARERSRDPSAQSNQGDLGYFDADTMVPTFATAVKALEKGTLSEPIKTQFGWHIIKLIDLREEPFITYEDIKDKISDDILTEKFKDFLENAKAESNIVYGDLPTVE